MDNKENIKKNLEQTLFTNAEKTAVIVRSEQNSKRLAASYSKEILQNNIKIITAEELEECLYLPNVTNDSDKPHYQKMIAEDKRVFSFYQTLLESGPKKKYTQYKPQTNDWTLNLNVTGYFNAVQSAGQFYALWNEINENMLDPAEVESHISDNKQQLSTWKTFCEIYQALRTFLNKHGLTDKLYIRTKSAIDTHINNVLTLFGDYNHVVFLDCWGDTPLSGYMFSKVYEFLKDNKQIEILLTAPKGIIDQDKWLLKPNAVSLELLAGNPENKKFSFIKAASPAEVGYKAVSYIAGQTNDEKTTVIDFDAKNNGFRYMLSDKLGIVPQIPYFNCRLYVWLDCMYKLLDSIMLNKKGDSILLCDINVFRDVIYTDKFIGLYFSESDEDYQLLKFLRQFVDDKIKDDYIYFDIKNKILTEEKEYCESLANKGNLEYAEKADKYDKLISHLEVMNNHIDRILNLRSVSELKEFFYQEIVGKRFFYDENFKVFETFFTAIEDTESLERMGIVSRWDKLFPNIGGVQQAGINLLKILADYLKDQKILLSEQTEMNKSAVSWTTIDKYEWTSSGKLILLNMNEKVFPSVSYINGFFSESQRKSLGLLNSDDMVSLQRLLLTDLLRLHNDVTVFYIENESKDMFGSGFIDEMKFYCEEKNIKYSDIDIEFNDGYNSLMQNVLGDDDVLLIKDKKIDKPDSLLFSFDMDKDVANNVMSLSASKLKKLLKKPTQLENKNQPLKTHNVLAKQTDKNQYTSYYIEDVIGVKFFEQQRIPRIDGILLGNLVHDFYRDIITIINDEIGKEQCSLTDNWFSDEHIKDISNIVMNNMYKTRRRSFLYKVPDDWTKDYLDDKIFPYAVDMLCRLFNKLRNDFGDKSVKLTPETEYDPAMQSNTKIEILGSDINERINGLEQIEDSSIPNDIRFKFDARADYYVESDNLIEIIDYKTGSKDSNHYVQLLVYEKTYTKKGKNVSSFFFNIFETTDNDIFQSIKQEDKFPNELFDYIYQAINPIFKLKYYEPDEKSTKTNNDK